MRSSCLLCNRISIRLYKGTSLQFVRLRNRIVGWTSVRPVRQQDGRFSNRRPVEQREKLGIRSEHIHTGTPSTQSNSENYFACLHPQVFNFTERLIGSHEYGNLIGAGTILPHGWKTGQELPHLIFPRARERQGKLVWFRD